MHCQPGETKRVSLVRIGGKQVIRGGNCIIDGPVDDTNITAVMESESMVRFGHSEEAHVRSWISGRAFLYCLFSTSVSKSQINPSKPYISNFFTIQLYLVHLPLFFHRSLVGNNFVFLSLEVEILFYFLFEYA